MPDSSSHSRPACQRGEWGIDRPRATISFESMSIRMPPLFLFSRQPPAVSVSPSAVTHRGRPSTTHRPLRWQRSSGVSAEMNFGRQVGAKLWSGSCVARHENRVLTNSTWSPTYAISWICTSPVTWAERGK